jgi:hypothetical protein
LDRNGPHTALLLERIKMKDVDTKQELHFGVSTWLRKDAAAPDDDIMLELPAVLPDVPPLTGLSTAVVPTLN